MVKIAITGGLACGKSTVGEYLSEAGAVVCDADNLAHELMTSGKRVFEEIVGFFGKDILGVDGEIDRQRLGQRVFSNPRELNVLNSIVHPEVKKGWIKWLECSLRTGCRAAAVIVPLLYESGEDKGWDAVVCVYASEALQVQRLAKRGLSLDDIKRRIAAQMSVSEKVKLADYVIMNDGTKDLLRQQAGIILENVRENEKWE